ncbi:MAG: hypothetical protein CVV51_00415 [Spirochaetae bacterium HGW-Spirochaetae-7]|jgi:hypothetical protein|nr:MAG: hypothetical protein CVV51_00415 [Spirochaetae bacterium HGW-Spirochaetae-7]
MRPLVAVLLMMTGLVLPAFALDSLDQWATTIWAQPLPTPKDWEAVVLTQDGPGTYKKASARTTYTSNPDGPYIQDYSGPDETSHSMFLKNGTLVSSTAVNMKNKRANDVMISPGRGQASFRAELKGKEPTTRTLPLKPGNIVMPEYVNLVRQAWRNGIRGGFVFKGLAPDGSMEIDMETRLIETTVPWKVSDKFDVPADFKSVFPDSQKYVVADFSLAGIFSLMYKFHNYSIFRIAPSGLEYVGSFGGDPKKAIFTFTTE